MKLLAAASLLAAALAVPALASEPESGKVSKSSPKVTWKGEIASFQSWQLYNQGQGRCLEPSCDTFSLEVADGPAPLKITVTSSDSTIIVEVVKPDGSKEQFGAEQKAQATIKNAPNGTYTINVAQNEQTTATHEGTAELLFPTAPAPAAPAATPAAGSPTAPVPTLSLAVGKVFAKRLKKGIPVRVKASAPVSRVAATLARGRKVVARGSVARIDSAGVVKLKVSGRPKPGTYTLTVTAVDGQGRAVRKTARVKIGR